MQDKLKEKLRKGIVIFDGAIGTEIYKRNFFINVSYEGLCLTNPYVVKDIHKSYYEAGADVFTTNTYGANANLLARFGLADKVKEINSVAVQLARQCGDEETLIAGSVGPIGEMPYKNGTNEQRSVDILAEQVKSLTKAGTDFILFETLYSLKDVERAMAAINQVSEIPFVVSLKVDRNGESSKGEPFKVLLQPIKDSKRKPTALGLNCGDGAESLLNALEKFLPRVTYPVIVQPNAGIPKQVDGRLLYMTNPEYLTTYALRYVNLGVRGIGGCCGTGPEHIRDMARSIRPMSVSEYTKRVSLSIPEERFQEPVLMEQKSNFGKKLVKGEWVTSVEIVPPRGYNLEETVEKAKKCREAGIDAINIPDGPRASSRISPLVTAEQILRKARIEPILHFCCRDKNLIGMQADLLGCAAVGIQNILFITGDPPKLGDYPFASAVFDVDSIGVVRIQDKLNRGIDLGGKAINQKTQTLIGVGADPNSLDMKREIRRIFEKAEAGAEFIITQPVFETAPLLKFLEKINKLNIPVLAGIWPLASYRNAEFMKNEVPGVIVPDEVMERMAKADTKQEQKEEGIHIARKIVAKIRGHVAGIQVSAPFGNVGTAIEVIKE